ncbi:MAG: transposase [Prevotella sp.]|nr:transposase [Prevotella sp.]
MEKPFYNRKKNRKDGYDYSINANYFVTVVVQDRLCLFGDIVDGEMKLNQAGIAIDEAIRNLPEIYDMCLVPIYVVMPNHIHFIFTKLNEISLCEVLRRFKSYTTHLYIEGVKNKGWKNFHNRLWQHSYYDHIIRNQRSYDFISNYIYMNPQRWTKDDINPYHDTDADEIMKHVMELM